jgi:hypothetical protein
MAALRAAIGHHIRSSRARQNEPRSLMSPSAFLAMLSLTGLIDTGGVAAATLGPASESWTS